MNAIEKLPLEKNSDADRRPLLRVVIVGHVDHGKSTLIGRLLHETGSLPDGKLDALKAVSARRGMPFEWSFLLDSLQAERNQGITIDTSQIRFRTATRDFILIDAPGHTEFLRNMITGAAQADAALLIVDAAEGIREQTRRHAHLIHLLGIRQVAVVVNKMDCIGYDPGRFNVIKSELTGQFRSLGLQPAEVIPIAARHGDGVSAHTSALQWHSGPTVLEMLDRFALPQPASHLPLRLPIQAVYKFDERRILAGRIESGRLSVGDEIVVLPAGSSARIKSLEAWPVADPNLEPRDAASGQSVGITIDRDLYVERGHVVVHPTSPAPVGRNLEARVFWLHHAALTVGTRLVVRAGTSETTGTVTAIRNATDPGELTPTESESIGANHIGEITVALSQPIASDLHDTNPVNGRIVLELEGRLTGGGLVLGLKPQDADVAPSPNKLKERAARVSAALDALSGADRLAALRRAVAGRIVFTTSFGLEDQVILHFIAQNKLDIEIVTLDTGRLFNETYELWAKSADDYGLDIKAVYPETAAVEALVRQQGINGFYQSRDARLACCHVRKVEPLHRVLEGAEAWITGLRHDQSANRERTKLVEPDIERGLLKVNPLFDWSRGAVLDYANLHAVPVNSLHARGYSSIGCAPCTRAIAPGEHERAGRWWWEDEDRKECGLHRPTN